MSASGDDLSEMTASPVLDDATIDALVRGDEVHPRHDDLAAFVTGMRAIGRRPPPSPSPTLATLMVAGPAVADRPSVRRRRGTRTTPARAPGLPLAVKIGAAVATAAAVLGAGAAGVLPAGADTVVRSAIEAVTPVDFATEERAPDSSADDFEPLSDPPGVAPGDRSADRPSGEGADGPDRDRRRAAGRTSDEASRRDRPRSGATIGGARGGPAASGDIVRHDDDRADDVPGGGVPGDDRDTADSDDDRNDHEWGDRSPSDVDSDGDGDGDDGRQDDSPAGVADQGIAPRPPSRTPWPRPATDARRTAPTAPRSISPTGP